MKIFQNQQDAVFLKFFFPLLVICLLWCLLWAHPCSAEPDGETNAVIAMGSSLIKKDVPAAREEAVTQAMRMAVEKTALQILPVERITEKFETLGGSWRTAGNNLSRITKY